MKRLRQVGAVTLVALFLVGLGLILWGWSDPPGCVAGEDPAVELANERAGSAVPYHDWCHEHDGKNLHVVEAGDGEVVLFIHGFPSIWYSLIRPMEYLREDYRVVAIDGLGAGLSDAPAEVEHYRLAAMAEHLDALIADLDVEQIHLVGHDWGAAFAGAYAQDRPDKIASVTIMSAPPQNIALKMLETSERQREISQYVERLKSATPALALLSGARDRVASGPRAHLAAGRIAAEEAQVLQDGTADLRRIDRHINWYRANMPAPDAITEGDFWPSRSATLDVPALLIWGDDDTVFDPAFIDMMRDTSADLAVLRLPNVGHAPHFEATPVVNEAIAQHVDENSPSKKVGSQTGR